MADVLDEAFPENEVAETPAPVAPEPAVETPAAAVETPPTPEQSAAEPETVAEAPKEDQRVPLATFLDQRDELRQLKAWKAEQEAQRQTPSAPNPFDDPDGYFAHQQQVVEQRLAQERFAMSDMFARQQHGAEAVENAVKWAEARAAADPAFAMSYMREQNPIDWIVRQHKRDDLMQQIGEDPDAFVLRRYAELNPTAVPAAPAAAAQPVPKPAQPPRSIASDPGNGASLAVNDDRAEFLAIFDKKAG